jgi:hypothetical protein
MPLQVDDVTALQNYLIGVVQRADHHGENVRHIVLALVGAIILFKNPDHQIKVFAREGSTGNVMWVHIGESQYVFSYEHASKSIALRRGTTQGEVVAHFTNATTIPEILHIFEGL